MKIAIGSDHGGFLYKEEIKKVFKDRCEFIDVGAHKLEPTDNYAEYSILVGEAVKNKKAELGIFICRTGVGAVVALNKVKGIRAGDLETVKGVTLAREKNDINCLTFGADNISIDKAIKIVDKFISTKFVGGRHIERLKVIADYEEKHSK